MNTPKKKCIDCRDNKICEEFPFDKSRNRYLSVCKECTSKRTRKFKLNNPEKWKQYDKNHNIQRKLFLDNWKSQGCLKCENKRIYTIDAHHLLPSKKKESVSDIRGMNSLKNELSKCIPLCKNCHAEFHYLENIKNLTIEEYIAGHY